MHIKKFSLQNIKNGKNNKTEKKNIQQKKFKESMEKKKDMRFVSPIIVNMISTEFGKNQLKIGKLKWELNEKRTIERKLSKIYEESKLSI